MNLKQPNPATSFRDRLNAHFATNLKANLIAFRGTIPTFVPYAWLTPQTRHHTFLLQRFRNSADNGK